MVEQPIQIHRGEQQLVGMWHQPDVALTQSFPAVIFCHGFTGQKAEAHRLFVDTARHLAKRGVGCLRFDFMGCGDSSGDFVELTVSSQVADLQAAYDHVQKMDGVDRNRIGLLGLSLGGLVVSLSVPNLQSIRAAALWNPVFDLAASVSARRTDETDHQVAALGYADYGGWAVGAGFLAEAASGLDPVTTLNQYRGELLFVLGALDETVPIETAIQYGEARKQAGRPVDVHVIPTADHTFASLPMRTIAIDSTVEWLCTKL